MKKSVLKFFDDFLPVNQAIENINTLAPLPTGKGVILFADKNDQPIQLLISANIRKAAKNRLLETTPTAPTKKTQIHKIVRNIHYCRCYGNFKSSLRYYQIARAIWPKNHTDITSPPKTVLIKIDPQAKWPFFHVTDKLTCKKQEKFFGPFPTRKAATEFIHILQQAFRLCQQPNLVDNPKKAPSCPYLQMSTCPAPCLGNISHDEYTQQISGAISAASGNIEIHEKKLKNKMYSLASQTEFEKAQTLKTQLTNLQLIKTDKFQWITDLNNLAILHIDRSAKIHVPGKRKKIQTFEAFLIKADKTRELGIFTLDDEQKLKKNIMIKLDSAIKQPPEKYDDLCLSLAVFFLYRPSPTGIWLDCNKQLSEQKIKSEISQKFNIQPDAHNQ